MGARFFFAIVIAAAPSLPSSKAFGCSALDPIVRAMHDVPSLATNDFSDDLDLPGDLERQRLRIPKISEVIADKIRAQIVRGELKEGEYLLPEGQLMEELQISRRRSGKRSASWKPSS